MTADPFELVRKWFDAFNAADLDALATFYHRDAVCDCGSSVARGLDEVRQQMAGTLGALVQREVRMIAHVETGAMRAEWRGRAPAEDGQIITSAGYDDFFVDDGLIRRQRGVRHPMSFQHDDEEVPVATARPARQYPAQPIVGVGAVIIHDGKIVVVKRRFEPLAGQWSLPGGRLELGETLEEGLAREMLEETGLRVQVGPVVDVFDRILLDPERRVRYHYVLIDYLCRPIGGTLAHGSDVAAAELVDPGDLERYRLTPKASAVIQKAITAARSYQWTQDAR